MRCQLIIVLIAASIVQPASWIIAAESFRKMKGSEIKVLLPGMEITDEVHWADLFNRDGTYVSWSMGARHDGKWTVRADELCMDDGKPPPDCRQVWIAGNKVELRRVDGGVPPNEGVLIKQQPRN